MYFKLCECWQQIPPAAQALRRLNAVVGALAGIKPEPTRSADVRTTEQPKEQNFDDNAMQAAMGGVAVYQGKPNDPMLDFIEQSKPIAQ